jgi:hypothetical protein
MPEARVFRSHETVPIKAVVLGDGGPLQISIRRQTLTEFAKFDRLFWKVINTEARRVLLVRRPGEERERAIESAISTDALAHFEAQLTDLQSADGLALDPAERATRAIGIAIALMGTVQPNERYAIDDEEICRRRLLELSDAQRAAYDTLKQRDDEAFEKCLQHAVTFIDVPAGQLRVEQAGETRPVTTGADLLLCIGRLPDALWEVLMAIRSVNALEDDAKNGSRSRSTSTLGSTSSDRTVPGDKPGTTAMNASELDSATSAAATPTAASPSGPTVN